MSNLLKTCIVDDDLIYRFTMVKTLESIKLPMDIMVFSDGEKAINFMLDNLDNEPEYPDVIFLDIDMPVMDGFQFMEEFIKIKPRIGKSITIYMVSSSIDPVDIERANNISAISDYIIKPIGLVRLKEIMENLLDERK
ncbi:response regulator [Maribacter arcticus]|uniref:Response regulator receiver domain-containing protein n=1 Tax=Maribacter arcticus TaxID=561365 RepID=A0A1T5D5J7_9FLAO|nr:response regulator [Maribacter arcticus]SKB66780.1 Response regulator receiver domain-containing protein [Maribacter arcticus]|tara:strand:- start:416 stop:829 length:414 start_codon:yes stop_codon:yes gene_type:complete